MQGLKADEEKIDGQCNHLHTEIHDINRRIPGLHDRIADAEDELRVIRGNRLEHELHRVTNHCADREALQNASHADLTKLEGELAGMKDEHNKLEGIYQDKDVELRTLKGDIHNLQQIIDGNIKESQDLDARIRDEEERQRALASKLRE